LFLNSDISIYHTLWALAIWLWPGFLGIMVKDNIINPKIPWEKDGPIKKEEKGELKGKAGARANQRENSFGILIFAERSWLQPRTFVYPVTFQPLARNNSSRQLWQNKAKITAGSSPGFTTNT
jgi:hypothetical protein